MTPTVALLDANVLCPAHLRDLVIQLAVTDRFAARWTLDIQREWTDALRRNEPCLSEAALLRTVDLMARAVPDCSVSNYAPLVPALSLPDPNDRHVLAAAIIGSCDVIVTKNLGHFPVSSLGPFNIQAQHPDAFLHGLFGEAPDLFLDAVRRLRARLKRPPYSAEDYLAILERQGLVITAKRLHRHQNQI